MPKNPTTLLLAAVGPEMKIFAVDVKSAALTRIGSLTLPSDIQYCWPSPDNRLLYVASSDYWQAPGAAGNHYLTVLAVDPETQTLRPFGTAVALRSRPVHMCLDPQGKYVFTAYHYPSGLSVHPIVSDGTVGEEIPQGPLDTGIYPHHVMAAPSGRQVLLLARGNNPKDDNPEDPGALKLFDVADGKLTLKSSMAPDGGYGFGPRDCEFHRSLPYVYISLERQRKLDVFRYENGLLSSAPVFRCETMENPGHVVKRQNVGAVHLHPQGHTAYVANRGGPANPNDLELGAENSIAVFSIDAKTGEPKLIQHADSHGLRPRTFGTDASGQMFWTANLQQRVYEENGERRTSPAHIATFHIKPNGMLEYAQKYEICEGDATLWWSGILTIAADQ